MTAGTRQRRTSPRGDAPTGREPGGGGRQRAWFVLAPLIAVVLAAGVWGITAPRHPAGMGEAVGFPGGVFTVDRVGDIDLSLPMAGPGMSMQMGAGVPEIPEGYRRFEVDVTVTTEAPEGMHLEPEAFAVRGEGVPETAATLTDEGGTFLPPGGVLTRTLTFEVPREARQLTLTIEGGSRPVDLTLGEAPAEAHQHGS